MISGSRGARDRLDDAASLAFVLLVATLPWTIAPMTVAAVLCGLLTVVAWLRAPRERRPHHGPLVLPALVWLAALALSAWFAEDRAASLPRVGKGLLPLLALAAAFHARDPRAGERALRVLLVSAGAAALVGLALWIAKGAAYPERARGAVGHYMTFGGQLLLWTSLAASIALVGRRRSWRIGAGLAMLAGLAALAATFTRSAWLGLLVSVGVILAFARPRWLVGFALVAALVVATSPPPWRDRFLSAFDPHHPANVERTHMWEAGVRMFLDHPITGVGLQDLRAIYDRYRAPASRESAGHLHSVFVQVAATMGAVGVVAFAQLYAALLRAAGAGLRRQVREADLGAAVRLGVTAALAGFLVAGLFEWNFGDEELLDMLYVLVGVAWASRDWPEGGGQRS